MLNVSRRICCTLARLDVIATDVRERRFVEHRLQIAIQAALDAASHVVGELVALATAVRERIAGA